MGLESQPQLGGEETGWGDQSDMWSVDTVIHRPPETLTRGRARVRQRNRGILAVPPSRKKGNVLIIEDSDDDDSQSPYITARGSRSASPVGAGGRSVSQGNRVPSLVEGRGQSLPSRFPGDRAISSDGVGSG